MQRILAHKIIVNGMEYSMSVVTIDDNNRLVSVEPFSGETPSTRFLSGTIVITTDSDRNIRTLTFCNT